MKKGLWRSVVVKEIRRDYGDVKVGLRQEEGGVMVMRRKNYEDKEALR